MVIIPSVNVTVSPSSVEGSGSSNLVYNFTRTGDVSSELAVNFNLGGTASIADYTSSVALIQTKSWTKLLEMRIESIASALVLPPSCELMIFGFTKIVSGGRRAQAQRLTENQTLG